MMPSTTPSNSRRRNQKNPSTQRPFQSSSDKGALTTEVMSSALSLPTRCRDSAPTHVLIIPAKPVAVIAPQRKAMPKHHHGSGS